MIKSEKKQEKETHALVQWFDVLFVMVLCFVTLLGTMLLRGKVLVGSGSGQGLDYSFSLPMFLIVGVVFALYLSYMLSHSDRELKEMVDHVYGTEEKTVEDEKEAI
ncbi:MAG: hypothetical protein WC975_01410 [Phycisphaerae bacterium]